MKNFPTILITFLLLILPCAIALPQSQSTTPTSQPTPPKILMQFPMNPGAGFGDSITLPVAINHQEYLFLLDTGATLTTLDKSIINPGQPIRTITTQTFHQAMKQNLYRPPPMSLNGHAITLPEVALEDLAPDRAVTGTPTMGVLGMDFLSNYILQLDFKNRTINFLNPATSYTGPGTSFNLTYWALSPYFTINFLGGSETPVLIDTGFADFGAVRKSLPDSLLPPITIRHEHSLISDAAGIVDIDIFRIQKKWQLANTRYTDLRLFTAPENILGMRFLADFVVTLDFPHRKLFLDSFIPIHPIPSPRYGLTPISQNGHWLFTTVSPRSLSLGIFPGDGLLAIDHKTLTNLPLWKFSNDPILTGPITLTLKRQSQIYAITIQPEFP